MADNVLIATTVDAANAQHQKIITEYLDGSGVPVPVTVLNPLPVAATISAAGLATTAKQDIQTTALNQIHTDITTAPLPAGTNNIGNVGITGTVSLPTNAAIETGGNLAAIKAKTDNLDVLLSTRLKPSDTLTKVSTVDTITNPVAISSLPAGLSTSANQATEIATLSAIKSDTDALDVLLSTRTKPSDQQHAIIDSGSVVANAGTNLNTSLLALEGGGNLAAILAKLSSDPATQTTLAAILAKLIAAPATAANQATEITSLANLDVALSTRTKPADQQHTIVDSGSLTANAGTNLNTSLLAVEAGGNLAAIKADVDKIPSQGQALAAASTPVVLTAIQQAALTPPAAITGFALEAGHIATIDSHTPALGQATKTNSVPVTQSSDQIVSLITGQSAQTATVNNILPASSGSAATDVSQYRSFAIQVVSTGTGGTFIFEGSVDNVNFVAIPVNDVNLIVPVPVVTAITASASNKIYSGACQFPYLRLRIATTITGGSIQAFSAFSPNPLSTTQMTVGQGSGTNLNVLAVIGTSAAAADGTGMPTTSIIRVVQLLSNGTTLDRLHNNWNTTTGDSGAKTVTFNGATQTNFDSKGAVITILCGTVSGTLPTLSAQLQWSPDVGTTWINYGAASGNVTATANTITFVVYPTNASTAGATPGALTLGSTQSVQINGVLPRTWRIVYTIGGTTPSFAITGGYVNYQM